MSDEALQPAAEDTPGADAKPAADRRTRRDRRAGSDRRTAEVPIEVERRERADRRQGPRRKRSMNQYDMDAEVLEFINAINRFKASSGRAFPTWSEVFAILRELGYEKRG